MHNALRIFELIVIFIYIALGVFLLVSRNAFGTMSPILQQVFGMLLVLYGIFRAYRAYKKFSRRNEDGTWY